METAGRRAPAGAVVASLLSGAAVLVALGYFPSLASPFVEPKLAVLVLAGALGFGARLWAAATGSAGARWDPFVARAAQALLAVTGLSALVAAGRVPPGAPYAATELVRLLALYGVALGAGLVAASAEAAAPRRLVEAIASAAALVALLGLLQHLGRSPFPLPTISVPGSTFGNRNVAAEAVAMALPFGLGLFASADATEPASSPRRRLAALLVVLQIVYLAVARARGAWVGGALGVAVFCALGRPRPSRAAIAAAVAIGALAVVAAAVPGHWTQHDSRDVKRFEPAARVISEAVDPASPVARTRLALWRRTLALYRARPLLGVGPGNFPVVFPRYAEPNAAADGVLSPLAVPRRAHDDLLERLAETGPLGLLALLALYAALGAAALRRARRARDENRPGDAAQVAAGAGAVAAFAGCGLTGFPFAMPGTVFLLGVAIGLLAVDAVDGRTPARSAPAAPAARVAAALVAVLLLAGGSWWSARRIAAAYWLARADAALHRGPGVAEAETALPFLARAARAAPRDFQVALRASAAELRAGHPPAAIDEARRALDLEPDSANAWEALARARLATGDARGAAEAADRALAILHTYPGALYTRAQASTRLGDDARAEAARARLTALAATDADARRLLDTLPRAPARSATP